MHSIDVYSDTCGYRELINEIGRKKIEKSLEVLLDALKKFIDEFNYQDKVMINELVLTNTVLDYFADLSRLKTFHHIENVNEVKLLAYESYWFLRRKPLQQLKNDDEVLYANEQFILTKITNFLTDEKDKKNLLLQEEKMKFFKDSLFYYLKYRNLTAQVIEFFLISFTAGEKYHQVLCQDNH
jgi:hypothetical protein